MTPVVKTNDKEGQTNDKEGQTNDKEGKKLPPVSSEKEPKKEPVRKNPLERTDGGNHDHDTTTVNNVDEADNKKLDITHSTFNKDNSMKIWQTIAKSRPKLTLNEAKRLRDIVKKEHIDITTLLDKVECQVKNGDIKERYRFQALLLNNISPNDRLPAVIEATSRLVDCWKGVNLNHLKSNETYYNQISIIIRNDPDFVNKVPDIVAKVAKSRWMSKRTSIDWLLSNCNYVDYKYNYQRVLDGFHDDYDKEEDKSESPILKKVKQLSF